MTPLTPSINTIPSPLLLILSQRILLIFYFLTHPLILIHLSKPPLSRHNPSVLRSLSPSSVIIDESGLGLKVLVLPLAYNVDRQYLAAAARNGRPVANEEVPFQYTSLQHTQYNSICTLTTTRNHYNTQCKTIHLSTAHPHNTTYLNNTP